MGQERVDKILQVIMMWLVVDTDECQRFGVQMELISEIAG